MHEHSSAATSATSSGRLQRGLPALETALQDLRYALRMLHRSPGFTAVALLSLAFGIGTNSAIFSVVDALLLKPLPVAGAERLVIVRRSEGPPTRALWFSYPAFQTLQASAAACSGVVALTAGATAVVRPPDLGQQGSGGTDGARGAKGAGPDAGLVAGGTGGAADAAEMARFQLVSGNFFSVLGVGMAAGRPFTAAEDTAPGAHPVAVLGEGYWRRRFGGDPGVVGKSITVNGAVLTVVGVTRRGFRGALADEAPDLFLPVTLRDTVKFRGSTHVDGPGDFDKPYWNQPNVSWLQLLARRRPGVSAERASALLNVVYNREKQAELVGRDDPDDRKAVLRQQLVLDPGARGISKLRGPLTQPLLLLLGVAGLVLLIACANVANLLLARADSRRKEMAVRLGIGAGRWRLLRQLVTESLLLAGLGGVLGVVFAGWGSHLLLGLVSQDVDPIPLDVDLDWRKIAFAVGVALATGLGFGLVPALQATRVDLASSLKQGARSLTGGGAAGSGRGRMPLGRALVAAQMGLSLLLLVGAGLFVRSLQNLLGVDPGFVRGGVLTATVNPRLLGYSDARLLDLYRRLTERLEALPGVRSASMSRYRLLTGSQSVSNLSLPGYVPRPNEDMDAQHLIVTARYFETIGMPLVAGRAFTARDREGSPKVVVVNQALVRRFLPHGSPLGSRFGFGDAKHARDFEIVGVVKDGKYQRLDVATPPLAYFPVAQAADVLEDVELRVAGGEDGAGPVAARLRRAIAEVEPNLPVLRIITLGDQLDLSLARERAIARLTGFFGLLALLLAAIGLYGVMSYSVARRTGEIGLRMALGAPRGRVLGLVLRETARLVAVGVAAGVGAALMLTQLAASQLFGISAYDPATLAAATLAMVAVALLAGFLPARRAADTEPMAALRYE
jgi:predicted permease